MQTDVVTQLFTGIIESSEVYTDDINVVLPRKLSSLSGFWSVSPIAPPCAPFSFISRVPPFPAYSPSPSKAVPYRLPARSFLQSFRLRPSACSSALTVLRFFFCPRPFQLACVSTVARQVRPDHQRPLVLHGPPGL